MLHVTPVSTPYLIKDTGVSSVSHFHLTPFSLKGGFQIKFSSFPNFIKKYEVITKMKTHEIRSVRSD